MKKSLNKVITHILILITMMISITFLRVPFASLGLGTSDIINYENDIEPNTKTNNWILQNGECYHMKYGCFRATIPYPQETLSIDLVRNVVIKNCE